MQGVQTVRTVDTKSVHPTTSGAPLARGARQRATSSMFRIAGTSGHGKPRRKAHPRRRTSHGRRSTFLARLRGERAGQLDGDEVLARDDAAPGEVRAIAVSLAHREVGCSGSAHHAIAAIV